MPRYYFDTAGGETSVDLIGVELPDDLTAHLEGVRYFGALLRDAPGILVRDSPFRVRVRTEPGVLVAQIEARDLDASS